MTVRRKKRSNNGGCDPLFRDGRGGSGAWKSAVKRLYLCDSQQKDLPKTMLFYNGGAFITCEGSQSLEDLKALEEQGVKILTCGTCLNHYGLTDRLQSEK